jgi:hypothetical protein
VLIPHYYHSEVYKTRYFESSYGIAKFNVEENFYSIRSLLKDFKDTITVHNVDDRVVYDVRIYLYEKGCFYATFNNLEKATKAQNQIIEHLQQLGNLYNL